MHFSLRHVNNEMITVKYFFCRIIFCLSSEIWESCIVVDVVFVDVVVVNHMKLINEKSGFYPSIPLGKQLFWKEQ